MDKEERRKFNEELRAWLSNSDDHHCADPLSDLDGARWSVHDAINSLRNLVEGLSDFKVGKARLLYNDFKYLTDEQTQIFLKNQEALETFLESAQGMIELMDSLLGKVEGDDNE